MTPSSEDYRLIPLTQGQFAIVDVADYEHLSQWKWYARWCVCVKGFYAARSDASGGQRQMHRVIINAGTYDQTVDVDHVNLNTLDNRRANLRLAIRAFHLDPIWAYGALG